MDMPKTFSSTNSLSSSCSDTCSSSTISSDDRRTVIVTGGAGFIGSHSAQRLLQRGDRVIVIDEMNDYYDLDQKRENLNILQNIVARDVSSDDSSDDGSSQDSSSQNSSDEESSASAFPRLIVVEEDICNKQKMEKLFQKYRPTHVIHLAARAGVRPSIDDPFIYVQTNVMGTVTLMELSAKYNVTNFVYASSSSVYGGSMKERFSEEDIVDTPVSQYAASKKSCELFAATYNSLYGLNCTGLRFFTVYGPRGRPDMAPFKFIHRVLTGVTIDQYGDGTSERDYTYIDDIVDGVILALDTPLGNQVVNLGRGTPCLLKEFIGTVERVCERTANINVMPMQPGDVPRTCADTSKAFELLGYKAKVSLREGLEETCQWYMDWMKRKEVLGENDATNASPQEV